jgi:hypothetical protein
MLRHFVIHRAVRSSMVCLALAGLCGSPHVVAASPQETVAEFDKALSAAKDGTSEARQRLAVKRVIRDAEQLLETLGDSPDRFPVLEFLFRARQQLIALDKDAEHRKALLDTCRELVKAPDEFAELRLGADLLLSQAEIAKQGAGAEARAKALRPLVARYIDTPAGAKVLRMAMLLALELGDNNLVNDLQEMIAERFAGDLDMITFQRDKLGGQVFGAPFVGSFERSDGKIVRFPMDGLGRSTMLLFWSNEGEGADVLEGLAAAANANKDQRAGRLEIISFNLDDLPDAGESIVRGHGADWQVVRLPGGRANPIYRAYVRQDPRILTVSPTGQAAMLMAGTTKQKTGAEGKPEYGRAIGSTLAKPWTSPRYVAQLSSLLAGDFLVFDPEGALDPSRPPEWKAGAASDAKPPARGADSVPEETLREIQACFVAPPARYRLSPAETLANYSRAVDLCRKAIAACSKAPDLWLVRNRLMVALLGLWKTSGDLVHLEAAIAEAKAAVDAGYPSGCDLIARFCLARGELRNPEAVPGDVLDRFVSENGGERAPGPVYAVAALLALDLADRKRFEDYRSVILASHTESPMMWVFTSFLLDRHHEYWLFQVPFSAGWSFGRREGYFMTRGRTEAAHRVLRSELQTLEGKPFRIPEDLESPWTMIMFCKAGPWHKKQDDGLPPSPEAFTKPLAELVAKRPPGELKLSLAVLDGDAETVRAGFDGKEPLCPVLTVPDGMKNPLVQRLGILSEDTEFNSVLIDRTGRIASMISGLGPSGRGAVAALENVIASEDEKAIAALLERGDVQAAKDRIVLLAPFFDPEARDGRGRPLPKPQYNLAHLRARARVFTALGELDKALVDAEEVVSRQLGTDGGMSLRTDELDESEALRDSILEQIKAKGS